MWMFFLDQPKGQVTDKISHKKPMIEGKNTNKAVISNNYWLFFAEKITYGAEDRMTNLHMLCLFCEMVKKQ